MADLFVAKRKLSEALESRETEYWSIMKSWYRGKLNKDEFDSRARSLLAGEIRLHNDFLFALLVKCQSGINRGSISVAKDSHLYIPGQTQVVLRREGVKPADFVPLSFDRDMLPEARAVPTEWQLARCREETLLPDVASLHARMLLGAWEVGLEDVSEEAARLLCVAVEHQMKNVLACITSHRTSWRVREGTPFRYDYGHGRMPEGGWVGPHREPEQQLRDGSPPPEVFSRLVEAEEMANEARRVPPTTAPDPITLFEVKEALQHNRHVIPSHSVYTLTMEHILASLWHPSQQESLAKDSTTRWRTHLAAHD